MSLCFFSQLLEQCCEHLCASPVQFPATTANILLLLLLLLMSSTFENNTWSAANVVNDDCVRFRLQNALSPVPSRSELNRAS